MNKRPNISVPKTEIEKVHDWVCLIVMIGMFLYTVFAIFQMPDTIPTHYNAKGEADGYGSKWSILIPLGIMIVLYFLLGLLQKHPEVHNFPGPRTERNFRLSRMVSSWIKLEVVMLFAYIIWSSIRDSLGQQNGLGVWFLPFLAVVFAVTMIYFLVRIVRFR